jgi:hypothetical protein|tara:strand:- start:7355 stop:8515 length:1161 start_codon:yes stop_codon:yes gene_type:complete
MNKIKNVFIAFGAAFSLIGVLTPLSLSAQTATTSDSDGYWSAGYQRGARETIRFALTATGMVGELSVESVNWTAEDTRSNCLYLFEIADMMVTDAKLNTAIGAQTQTCPATIGFSLFRAETDSLEVTFIAAPELVGDLGTIPFRPIIRPVRDQDKAVPVAGANLLGLVPGMDKAETLALLAELGFETEGPQILQTGDGFTISGLTAVRDVTGEPLPLRPGETYDMLTIMFTSVIDGTDEDMTIASLKRDWVIDPQTGLTSGNLTQSLKDRLGPVYAGTQGDDRYYNRNGENIVGNKNDPCFEGPLQELTVSIDRNSAVINPNCGAIVKVTQLNNASTGLAQQLVMTVYDPDIALAEFWKLWAGEQAARIAETFGSLSSATDVAPEL